MVVLHESTYLLTAVSRAGWVTLVRQNWRLEQAATNLQVFVLDPCLDAEMSAFVHDH